MLLHKLNKYGLEGNVLAWFRSWLQDRRQYTKFKDMLSNPSFVNFGIPQRTLLSSLLFNLFFNDVVLNDIYSNINLFAGDALIWIAGPSIDQCIFKMNSDLNEVSKYFVMTKLKQNLDKTKAMIIGHSDFDPHSIMIEGQYIEIVDKIKYLGIIVDPQ